MEALLAGVLVFSWALLLHHEAASPAAAGFDWFVPLNLTWLALVLPGKIALVRSGSPLPTERTEEHHQFQDLMRRNSIATLSAWSWSCAVFLLGCTLWRVWPSAASLPGMQWVVIAAFLGLWGNMMFVIFRGQRQAATLGRILRPAGSSALPFRRASVFTRPYFIWFAIWFGGILVLIAYSNLR
jgi:hypothetical protein